MRLNRQNKIVVGVIAFILALTVGYALFNESLNINGTATASGDFKIVFTSVGEIKEVGSANATATIEEPGKQTLNIVVPNLQYPGAYAEIPVVIKNEGSIDGILTGITANEQLSNDDIEVTYSGIGQDEEVASGESKTMTIKVKWKEESTTSSSFLKFGITLNYEQKTGESDITTPGGEEFVFPVVEGQLGDNVFFKYDSGNTVITGSGPMREGAGEMDTLAVSIGKEVVNNIPMINTGDETKNMMIGTYLGVFIAGKDFDYLEISEEEFKGMLTSTDQESGGIGLSEEVADNVLKVINSAPKFKSVTIAEGVTSTMRYLFQLHNIDTLTLPSSITSIGDGIFDFATVNNLILADGTTTVLENLTSGEDAVINNIVIPDGVTTIKTGSLSHLNFTTLTIPSSVITIENSAINCGSNLTTIINKTGRAFDWNGIINGISGEEKIEGTIEWSGRTINIIR